jgi:trafficking protein particle complex subunit 2
MRGRVSASSSSAAGQGGAGGGAGKPAAALGLREGEVRVVFRAMLAAYVALLQNPFYEPDEHAPLGGAGGKRITSRRFGEEMRRIGETWTPGVTSL